MKTFWHNSRWWNSALRLAHKFDSEQGFPYNGEMSRLDDVIAVYVSEKIANGNHSARNHIRYMESLNV